MPDTPEQVKHTVGLVEIISRAICGSRADELVQAGNPIGEPCEYPAWMLAQPEARRVIDAIQVQLLEPLRIMSKQRKSSQMDEDDLESADWQGAYDWFCDESRALHAALTRSTGDAS